LKQARLIFNPASGKRKTSRALFRLLEDLKHQGIKAEPCPTSAPGHATSLAREALEKGIDLVLVWGGDGTLNEVAWGMLGSTVPLGLLPGGSVNVFAREAGIPLRARAACRILNQAELKTIPVGMAGERPFLMMVGMGLDAEVVRRLDLKFKRRFGTLAFWIRGFALLATHDFPPFTVRIDGSEHRATSLIAGKIRYYGGKYVVTPEAGLEKPSLDVMVFQGRSIFAHLRLLAGVLGRFHLKLPDVLHFHTTQLEIEAPEAIYYQLDGELGGSSSLTVGIRPQALRVLLPPSST
jgi:YegS/Rv2252/BmrU family lipid kinase